MQKGDDEVGGMLILDIFEFLSEPFRLRICALGLLQSLQMRLNRGGNMKYHMFCKQIRKNATHVPVARHHQPNTAKCICHQKQPGSECDRGASKLNHLESVQIAQSVCDSS